MRSNIVVAYGLASARKLPDVLARPPRAGSDCTHAAAQAAYPLSSASDPGFQNRSGKEMRGCDAGAGRAIIARVVVLRACPRRGNGSMPKILIVEDNEDNWQILSRRLRRRGYDVVVARDGKQG